MRKYVLPKIQSRLKKLPVPGLTYFTIKTNNSFFLIQIHCEKGCPCPRSDCLNHNQKPKCPVIDASHNYNVCVESLKTFQSLCEKSCQNNSLNCESACFDKYGANLKTCPCQVKKSKMSFEKSKVSIPDSLSKGLLVSEI